MDIKRRPCPMCEGGGVMRDIVEPDKPEMFRWMDRVYRVEAVLRAKACNTCEGTGSVDMLTYCRITGQKQCVQPGRLIRQ